MHNIRVGLEARIHKPKLIPNLIRRKNLEELLNQSGEKLIVFHGTMGFGKTVFINSYGRGSGRAQSWYHLNSLDNDMVTFSHYLSASLCQAWPNFSWPLEAFYHGKAGFWEVQQLAQSFIYAIDTAGKESDSPFLDMVLDDFQEIENESIWRFLDQILCHLPEGIRIFIATKGAVPPFTDKYLINGDAKIISAESLAFSVEETGLLMNRILKDTPDKDAVQSVFISSEGWPAGVMSLCLFMKQRRIELKPENVVGVIKESRMHDFLMYELFKKLSFDIQRFLVLTSPLEYLSAGICLAVSGVPNSAGILDYLIKEGLFIQKVEDHTEIYRYHSLFREFLISQLAGEERKEVQKKAALYLLNTDQKEEAAAYAIKSESPEIVIKVIESVGMELLEEGRKAMLESWLEFTKERQKDYPVKALLAAGSCFIQKGESSRGLSLLIEGMKKSLEQKKENSFLLAGKQAALYLSENHLYEEAGILLARMKQDYERVFWGKPFPFAALLLWADLYQGRESRVPKLSDPLAQKEPEIHALARVFDTAKEGAEELKLLEKELLGSLDKERAAALCGLKILEKEISLPAACEDLSRLSRLVQVWGDTPYAAWGQILTGTRLFQNGEKRDGANLIRKGTALFREKGTGELSLIPEIARFSWNFSIISGNQGVEEDSPYHLAAHNFGDFQIHVLETGEELRWRTKKAWECMAWLLHVRGKEVSREELLSALWDLEQIPSNEVAALHNILSSIRKTLKPYGMENLIQYQNHCYFLKPGMIGDQRAEADKLCRLIQEGDGEKIHQYGYWLLELSRAPYLKTVESQWAEETRYEYENLFLKGLILAGDYSFKAGRKETALKYYRQAFTINPYEEWLAIRIMEIMAFTSQPRDIRKYYQEMVLHMEEELGCKPGPNLKKAFEMSMELCRRV